MMTPSPGEDPFAAMARVAADPEAFAKRIAELKEAVEASEAKLVEAARAMERLQAAEAAFAKTQAGSSTLAADLTAREAALTAREAEVNALNGRAIQQGYEAQTALELATKSHAASEAAREQALAATAEAQAGIEANRLERVRLGRIAGAFAEVAAGIGGA
jgi:hypothetical protein